jgi:hypothetical protein
MYRFKLPESAKYLLKPVGDAALFKSLEELDVAPVGRS